MSQTASLSSFSPLFIAVGSVTFFLRGMDALIPAAAFSPLFIAVGSVTLYQDQMVAAAINEYFQSAFHRGRECNFYHDNFLRIYAFLSPLFIAVGS